MEVGTPYLVPADPPSGLTVTSVCRATSPGWAAAPPSPPSSSTSWWTDSGQNFLRSDNSPPVFIPPQATFVLVARDPLNRGGAFINPLEVVGEEEQKLFQLGESNKIRYLILLWPLFSIFTCAGGTRSHRTPCSRSPRSLRSSPSSTTSS